MKGLFNGLFGAVVKLDDFKGLIDLSWTFTYFAEAVPELFWKNRGAGSTNTIVTTGIRSDCP